MIRNIDINVLLVTAPKFQTVTHEMGHNLGISHDFVGDNPRKQDGVECYGYMDYNDDTNQWSPCSVADFTSYINQQSGDFCLASLGRDQNSQ